MTEPTDMSLVLLYRYQGFCQKDWSPEVAKNPLYFVIGLAGETGEVCEEFKKAIRDGREVNKEKVAKELGDVLWYLTNIASNAGLRLDEIINKNMEKLSERHPDGYVPFASDSEQEEAKS